MLEKDFLKKLNILYIDNNEEAKTKIELKSHINKIYAAVDTEEALKVYESLEQEDIRLDAIISEVNISKLNGVTLLKKIRLKNEDIPFFLTSEYFNEDILLDSINHNISGFFNNPINIEKLLKKLNRLCHKYHQHETIKKQKLELERYLSAIDNVAIISKTDLKGNITFVNDIFCEVSKYKKDELLGYPHNIVRHPDTSKEVFFNLWKTIKNGDIWQGKLKNQAKDKTVYYVNTTVLPIYDDLGEDIIEFVGVRFLTTEEELSQREFRKKVVYNIQEYKKKDLDNSRKIKNLENEVLYLKRFNNDFYKNKLSESEEKNQKLQQQIIYSDEEIKDLRNKNSDIAKVANEKVKKITSEFKYLASKCKLSEGKNIENQNKIINQNKTIHDLELRLVDKNKQISDLHEVISFKEKEFEKLKEELSSEHN